jgi:hypothetical protein
MIRSATAAMLAATMLVAGCAVAPASLDRSEEAAIAAIDLKPDEHELRLLLRQLEIAVMARYGAARSDDYLQGETAGESATRILRRVRTTQEQLAQAYRTVREEAPFRRVEETDLDIAIVYLLSASTEPTRQQLRRLVLQAAGGNPLSVIQSGRSVIANAARDALYLDAYVADFRDLVGRVPRNDRGLRVPSPAQWRAVTQHLMAQCEALRGLPGAAKSSATDCKVDGVPGH